MNTHDKYELPPLPDPMPVDGELYRFDSHTQSYVRADIFMDGHEELESQLEAIGAGMNAADRLGRWLSAALEDPSTCQEMKEDILTWMAAGSPSPQAAEPVSVPKHLIERLQKHCEDKSNTAFARSTMREALQYLTAEPVKVDAEASVPSDDALVDALSNLEHDNYELSYSGYKNRQADIALIRAALARHRPSCG